MTKESIYEEMIQKLSKDSAKQMDFINFYNQNKDRDYFMELFKVRYGAIYEATEPVSAPANKSTQKENSFNKSQSTMTFPDKIAISNEELKRIDTNIASIAFWVKFWSILSIISLILWVIFSVMGIIA